MKKVIVLLIVFISTIFTPVIKVCASDNSYNVLEGSSYKLPNDDLNALKPILKDKEIIGVGEATHGTKEFFEMKHRLFKFLVEEMDFRVFAIEESMSNMELINEYILGKDYKLDRLMSNLLAPWQTKEMMDLINWAKEYNNKASKENKIRFYGFDSQENNNGLETILKNYYDKVDSLSFKEMYKKTNKDDYKNVVFYRSIEDNLKINKEKYIKQTSKKEYEFIEKAVENMIGFNNDDSALNRDQKMAKNVSWIKDYEKKYYKGNKIMLWGHNGHISIDKSKKQMGYLLKEQYGEKYYSIGQIFYSGYFMSDFRTEEEGKFKRFYLAESELNSVSGKINELYPNDNTLFFDFKEASKNEELDKIFSKNMYVNEWGAEDESYATMPREKQIINNRFDSVIYFKNTKESTYLKSNGILKDVEVSAKKIIKTNIIYSIIYILITIIGTQMHDKNKKDNKDENKTGILLTATLIYFCIADIFNSIVLMPFVSKNGYLDIIKIIVYLGSIISSILIIRKNKIGVYGYFIFLLLKIIIDIGEISTVITYLFQGIILFYFIYRKRKIFNFSNV